MNKIEFYPVLRRLVTYTLYVHVCKEKNKYGNYGMYFGITYRKPENRWGKNGKGYKRFDKNGNIGYFYKSILKYGWDNFEHIILHKHLSKWEAEELEKMFISYYHTDDDIYGYNGTKGGEGGILNEKYKEKLRIINTGKILSTETRNKISKSISKESHPMYGRKGELNPNSKNIGNNHANSIQVRNIDTNIIYGSIRDAERLTGVDHSSILKCCKNISKTAGGYHWEYISYNDRCKGRKIICLETLKVYDSIRQAGREFNTTFTHLIKCCKTKTNKFNGLSWMYYDEYLEQLVDKNN